MRLVSYNILDGGEGRADPLAEVILAQRPDIVAIVEADNIATLERIATRLKMDFIRAPGNKSACALLSNWAISKTIIHALLAPSRKLEKSFLEAEVIDPTGFKWTIGVVHLHAHALEEDEQQREREIAIVLDAFADRRAKNQPHLLVGDFNSNAPYQQIDPARCTESTSKAWQENGGKIPRRVVQKILDAGYVDSLRAFNLHDGETATTFTTLHPGQRVDYVFVFGFDASQITNAWVEKDRLAKYASDHFPIGVDISTADGRR